MEDLAERCSQKLAFNECLRAGEVLAAHQAASAGVRDFGNMGRLT